MHTIIQSIVLPLMAVPVICIPASPLPSSLYNIQIHLDEQPHTNNYDSHKALSNSQESENGSVEAHVPDIGSSMEDHHLYANCVPQPEGFGPRPEKDTPTAFRHFEYFHNASQSASAPRGYEVAARDLDGVIESNLDFLGDHLLHHYDPDECARLCNNLPTCASFNLYFERDPLHEPNTTAGCPDPPSTTNINCVLWHSRLEADAAINFGEIREKFHVVIAGSNLYNSINGTLDLSNLGFSGPRVNVDNDAAFEVSEEPTGGYSTLLGETPLYYNYYGSSDALEKYDPTVCARLCLNITSQAKPEFPFTNNAYPVCSMFVAYELVHDGPLAMVCELYSSVWSSHYQTLRELVAFRRESDRTVTLRPHRVSVYQRSDYQYPAICAMEQYCGKDFYAGGDCSGWGQGHC